MSSQRYINAASEYKYMCILIYNTFCSATFYNDPPMITHAVAQELGPQEVKHTRNTRKCYFCDPDQKTSSQDYICQRIALDVNVLREDTISYM